ncbi:MAG TPA: efflux RND transporter permease subunit [Patescibacteria group bacterium]|nr:efflux RND transporter permease subunit [Patescibacteria group bacterium]
MYSSKPRSHNFNYRITSFFLHNQRLTILTLFLVVFIGIVSTLYLRTTGFPSPRVPLLIVQTMYPGASSETIVKDITQPLEGAIKDIDGIETYSSRNMNSVSVIILNVHENADVDSVRNQVDSAVKSISLPTGVESPTVTVPNIMGPDHTITIAGNNLAEVYETLKKVRIDISELPETALVDPLKNVERVLVVTVDTEKARASGIRVSDIQRQLASIGESLPVTSEAVMDGQNKTVLTAISGKTIDDIKNIEFVVSQRPSTSSRLAQQGQIPIMQKYTLADVAAVTIDYRFVDDNQGMIALNVNGTGVVLPAVVLNIRATEGSDSAKYAEDIEHLLQSYENEHVQLVKEGEQPENTDKILIIENFTANKLNQEQVHEVVSGLVGSTLDTNGSIRHIGWLLGGIQLVFLIMLAFVSWRAALVAAFSIPLSLVFSNIYLYFTGNDLNTLVLFSLVLVIGLVVDPALVILESIQRKIDLGLRGKKAALAAIDDVGNGLFLATLTNIIVFAPFAVISGIIGEIFSYIPLTVIPATIGSYLVPLIFLAWIGGLILKPKKNKTNDEEKNLWGVARWLIQVNTRILHGSMFVRLIIIFIAFMLPLFIAGFYVSSERVKIVQFATNDTSDMLQLSGAFTPNTPKEQQYSFMQETLQIIADHAMVQQVYPNGDGISSMILLVPNEQRVKQKATTIADQLNESLDAVRNNFFDIRIQVISTGPPAADYEIAIAIKNNDPEILHDASIDVGKTLAQVCVVETQVSIEEHCTGEY